MSRPTASSAARVLLPRGALALQPVDGARLFALRAGLAMAVPAVALAVAGHAQLAVATMLGAFTTTFGRNLPYRRRAWVLALVALAMTCCVAGGAALAAVAHPRAGEAGAVVIVTATALVAGLAKLVCDAARLPGLGAVLILFSFAVAANGVHKPTDVPQQAALAALGASVAWLLALAGRLAHPDRPQRLAVAAALRALALSLDAQGSPRARHQATVAVLEAYRSLGRAPLTDARHGPRGDVYTHLTDLAWSELIRSAQTPPTQHRVSAQDLRRQADLLAARGQSEVVVVSRLGRTPTAARSPVVEALPDAAARGHLRRAVVTVPALRMALGTAVAGWLAVILGLGHGYWAAISAAAVLHSVNLRTTALRSIQRTLGTAVGLLLALVVLQAHPAALTLVLVIVGLEVLLEYVAPRNYALGIVFLTPLALLLSELATPTPAGHLALDRGTGSLLGIVIGLACALLIGRTHAARRAEEALARCQEAAEEAQRQLDQHAGGRALQEAQLRLSAALVELHEANDAAAGELWQAGIDPALLAATEQRAYRLLDLLLHESPS